MNNKLTLLGKFNKPYELGNNNINKYCVYCVIYKIVLLVVILKDIETVARQGFS